MLGNGVVKTEQCPPLNHCGRENHRKVFAGR